MEWRENVMATPFTRVADLNIISFGRCHEVFSFHTDWEPPALGIMDSSVSTVPTRGGLFIGASGLMSSRRFLRKINVHTFHIYCPICVAFGVRNLRVTTLSPSTGQRSDYLVSQTTR